MSWNDNLYLYSRSHGGVYYGQMDDSWNGTLLLEYRGLAMVVRCDMEPANRTVSHTARALALAGLERPYRLRVSRKGALRQGVNALLSGLDRGAERLKVGVDLYRDYGAPEVMAGRTVRTSNPEFTKAVFRDLELRTALLDQPESGVAVGPCGFGEQTHQVEACAPLDGLSPAWDVGLENQREAEPGTREPDPSPGFEQGLERLLHLAWAAHGAVLAWRM